MFRRPALRHTLNLTRHHYSTTEPKVPIALIAQLRKQTQVSLSKARTALSESNNDIPAAIQWLQNDLATSGEAKALKLGSRATAQGLVSTSVLQGANHTLGASRAALVELNCETDFVARNELFGSLASDIAHTAAFFSDTLIDRASVQGTTFNALPLDTLRDLPLISHKTPSEPAQGTIATAIRDTINKVGENITLNRASALITPDPSPSSPESAFGLGSYVHGAQPATPLSGQVAAIALLNLRSPRLAQLFLQDKFCKDLAALERSVARQVVGFDTQCIEPDQQIDSPDQALYNQPFITFPGELNGLPVREVLEKWGINQGLHSDGLSVSNFIKWKVGV